MFCIGDLYFDSVTSDAEPILHDEQSKIYFHFKIIILFFLSCLDFFSSHLFFFFFSFVSTHSPFSFFSFFFFFFDMQT